MNKILDKLVIFLFCVIVYITNNLNIYVIVPILLSIIFSCSFDLIAFYGKNIYKLKIITFLLYILASLFLNDLLFFIPLIIYDIYNEKKDIFFILFAFFIIYYTNCNNIFSITHIIIPFTFISALLKIRTMNLNNSKKEYSRLRDNSVEYSLLLKNENKNLIQKQDYEINIAILKERNRISMEIHDNVGHLLSSAILQIGALISTNNDISLKKNLNVIKSTLSEGMDSIRCSIHNMHDEFIDLKSEVYNLINTFTFCNITLEYDITQNISKEYKLCFISIIKEALANIIKHSNATNVKIILREHPALYQLLISDNGTKVITSDPSGIGMSNMKERVENLSGIININKDNGFCIFISIPKNLK